MADTTRDIRWCGPQYPDWSADADGRLYLRGIEVTPRHTPRGRYPRVECHGQTVPAHVLVCTAFHGPRPAHMECRHLNDIKTDLRAANLCWGTRSQNKLDAVRNGVHNVPYGEAHPRAKLTDNSVHAIRCAYAQGRATQAELARTYGISHTQIHDIVHGRAWKHLFAQPIKSGAVTLMPANQPSIVGRAAATGTSFHHPHASPAAWRSAGLLCGRCMQFVRHSGGSGGVPPSSPKAAPVGIACACVRMRGAVLANGTKEGVCERWTTVV